ncbi:MULTISPECIES: C39 family peptidase [Clostridia]|uniref:C39 family peptidase n=1 Tax=Clostridia TaxID=186801 RepID=UPI0006E45309|nr:MULTISPECIES: C39 family peptidase [Clostridia]MBE0068261.1 C39 family peptidase [Thermoanaerobacterium thermosaccharolyticum]MBE0228156.1 C39 family peptidase [Thermoanaerobacterium thermosaccharolyticum]
MLLDPKSAATIAKIVIQAAKDDETRNKIIFISLAPIISVLLILAFIVYILTNPLEMLSSIFFGNELTQIKNIRSQYGYEQLINPNDNSYLESSGLDFSGVSFKDGVTEVVYYNQADERWKDKPYGKTGTIGRSGCGPTSLAIVVSSLTDKKIDPVQMSTWAYENGYYCEGVGSYHTLIPDGAKHFGLKVEGCASSEPQKIVDALVAGKLIIAIMAEGHFTRNGHFIVLRGVTEDKKILVADPVSRTRSEEKWDLSIVLNEANKGADAGGPFWIISKQ